MMPPPTPSYLASLHHDGSARYVRPSSKGELRLGGEVTLRFRAAPSAPIERILVRTCPDGEQRFTEMHPGPLEPACRWWEAGLRLEMPVTSYRFLVFTPQGVFWYNGGGVQPHNPTDAEDFRLLAEYHPPAWLRQAVFYQIFPDRFASGDPSNNVRDGEYDYWGNPVQARRWGEPPSASHPAAMVEFFGGDLLGIEQKLDYLAELGVNAIYLNPIFTALSNHRYDVTDYFNVDPHLGGNPALVSLRQATMERGMRLVLDIVPNHCGIAHPWFQAALKDPQAATAEYFSFHKHPHDYACWLGVRGLPKLNYRSQALRQVMYAGPDSIIRHWLRPPYAIDGWRLDVANMLARQGADQLGSEVAQAIRAAVRAENPAAYLLGENFFDGSLQLQGDAWDAVMNYSGFAKPLWYWLSHFEVRQHGQPRQVASNIPWPAGALTGTWQAYRAAIPWVIARQQFNLLGSHDTRRILSVVSGNIALNRLAAAVLMTYPGVPSIYYGDEIGMGRGERDSARDCMTWDPAAWDQELLSFYKTLIHLRKTSLALLDGGFQVLQANPDSFAYLRDADGEYLILIGCRSAGGCQAESLPVVHGAIPDGVEFIELFSGRRLAVAGGHLLTGALPQGVQLWRARP